MSADAPQLASAAVRLARAAIELLDLRQHAASHPRLGIVDHVSLQPAGSDSSLHAAAEVARAIGALVMMLAISDCACSSSTIKYLATHTAARMSDVNSGARRCQRTNMLALLAPLLSRPLHCVRTAFISRRNIVLSCASGDMLGVGPPPVPVMLYGAAHPQDRGLQDVRRSLGYFRGASAGMAWAGSPRPTLVQ